MTEVPTWNSIEPYLEMGKKEVTNMEKMKWLYTFVLLAVTIGWAVFLVYTVWDAITVGPEPIDVVAAAGVGVLLGALIAWSGNVNQYWFRKKTPTKND